MTERGRGGAVKDGRSRRWVIMKGKGMRRGSDRGKIRRKGRWVEYRKTL